MTIWFDGAVHGRRRRLTRSVSFVLALVLAVPPQALAQLITDPKAPIAYRPRIGSSAGGTPVVDIVKPSFGGISHNKFDRYDVDMRGVILNNSRLGGTSIIGGKVLPNANLAGTSGARLILNEATGSRSTRIEGPTEVFGRKADVVIANPSGVICASCPFINAGAVTLTTGVPEPDYQSGAVGYAVRSGTISISGTGVSGPQGQALGAIDLIGRQLSLEGPITASGRVRARAGAMRWDAKTDQATALADAAATSGPSIRSTSSGTIRGSTVSIVGAEPGRGVALGGEIRTGSGALRIASGGDLSIAGAASPGAVAISAEGRVTLSGSLRAGAALEARAAEMSLTAASLIASADSVSLVASGDVASAGTVASGGVLELSAGGAVQASGALLANGLLLVDAHDLVGNSLALAGSDVVLAASASVALSGSAVSSLGSASLTAPSVGLSAATAFEVPGRLRLAAADRLTVATVLDTPGLDLAVGDLAIASNGAIVQQTLALAAGGTITNDGLIYGRASASLSAAGLVNRAGGMIYGPALSVTAGSFSGEAGSQAGGDSVAVSLGTGSFELSGRLESTRAMSVAAGSLAVRSGATLAGDGVTLTAGGTASNSGKILSLSDLSLDAAGLDQRGEITANGLGTLALHAGGLSNSGAITLGGALAVTAAAADNLASGSIAAGRLTLGVGGGLDNAGSIEARGELDLSAASATNQATGTMQAALVGLDLAGAMVNRGAIGASAQLGVTAGSLDNAGSLQSAGDLWLDLGAGALANSGAVKAAGTILAGAGTLSNAAGARFDAEAIGLDLSGAAANHGIVAATDLVQLRAGSLDNSGVAGAVAYLSGATLDLAVGGYLSNGPHAAILAEDAARIRASSANLDLYRQTAIAQGRFDFGSSLDLALTGQGYTVEAGRIVQASGDLSLSFGGNVAVLGTIASGGDLSLTSTGGSIVNGPADLASDPGQIFAGRNLSIRAAGNVTNSASLIQSLGDMEITTGGTVLNDAIVVPIKPTLNYRSTYWATINAFPQYENDVSCFGNCWGQIYVPYTYEGRASIIDSQGKLAISAGVIENKSSTVSAGGDLTLEASSVANTTQSLPVRIYMWKVTGSTHFHSDDWETVHKTDLHYPQTDSLIYSAGRLSVDGSFVNTGTVQAQTAVIDGPSIVIGITDPGVTTPAPRLPDPVIDITAYGGLPAAGLAAPSVTVGGTTFLHAAPIPPPAGEPDQSSILGAVGDPRKGLTFFADPLTERRLIQQALVQQTGRAVLDPSYRDPKAQQQALWQGTVEFLKANPQIRLGESLSPALKAKIQKPILWYEERGGVMMPVLLLPEARLAEWTKESGGQILAGDLTLSGDSVTNTGRLIAAHTLLIDAGTFLNERRVASSRIGDVLQSGGLVMADALSIFTTGDLTNRGGALVGAKSVTLSAGGDLLVEAQAVETHERFGSKKRWKTVDSLIHESALVSSGGDLTLIASGALSVLGSTVTAAGDATLSAGGPVTIASVVDDVRVETGGKKKSLFGLRKTSFGSLDERLTNVASLVSAGGDLSVVSGSDVAVTASHLVSGGDTLVAAGAGASGKADASVSIVAGQDAHLSSSFKKTSGLFAGSGGGFFSVWGKDKRTATGLTIDNAASSLTAGGDLTVTAPKDIGVVGSALSASGDLALLAGRDVAVTPGLEEEHSTTSRERSGLGIGVSSEGGGISVMLGVRKDSHETADDTVKAQASLIQAGGDIGIGAGRDLAMVATDIAAGGSIDLAAGRDLALLAATESERHLDIRKQSFAGITATVGSRLGAAVETLAEVAPGTGDGLGGGLATASATYLAARQAYLAGAKDFFGAGRIEVSITAGLSLTETKVASSLDQARPTTVYAGQDLSLTAGRDLHLTGTQASTGSDLLLAAGNDVLVESVQSRFSSSIDHRSISAGIGVGFTVDLADGAAALAQAWDKAGIIATAEFAELTSREFGVENLNAHLFAGDSATLVAGADATLAGAVIGAPRIDVVTGGDLLIESRADLARFKERSVSGSATLTITPSGTASFSGGVDLSRIDAAYVGVPEQSGLVAGKNGAGIVAGGDLTLTGAKIVSEAGPDKTSVSAKSLSFSDIGTYASAQATSYGLALTGGLIPVPNVSTPAKEEQKGAARATLSPAELALPGQSQSLAALNRDPSIANDRVETYDIEGLKTRQMRAALIAKALNTAIGDLSVVLGLKDGSPEKIALHALAGAITAKVAGTSIAGGALAGAVSEIATAAVGKVLADNPNLDPATKNALAQWAVTLAGAAVGAAAGDAMAGAATANAAYKNNYLKHAQAQAFIDKLQACGSDQACKDSAVAEAAAQSDANALALRQCGGDKACYAAALAEMQDSFALLNDNEELLRGVKSETFGSAAQLILGNTFDRFGAGAEESDFIYAMEAGRALAGQANLLALVNPQSEIGQKWAALQAAASDPRATKVEVSNALNAYLVEAQYINGIGAESVLDKLGEFATGLAAKAILPKPGSGQWHHVCTDKNCAWTPHFKELFDGANMSLQDEINLVYVLGHQGPHPTEYHSIVFNRLNDATRPFGKGTAEYRAALRGELQEIGREAQTPGTYLNHLVRTPGR